MCYILPVLEGLHKCIPLHSQLLAGPLRPGVEVLVRVHSMGQIDLFKITSVGKLNIVVSLFGRCRWSFWESCDVWSWEILRSQFYIFFDSRNCPLSPLLQTAHVCKLSLMEHFPEPEKCKSLTTAIGLLVLCNCLCTFFTLWDSMSCFLII